MSALKSQVGGGHYKDMAIQPAEYNHRNGIPFIEGCVIKYVSRWRAKGGVEDLKKARHFLDMLIEMESPPRRFVEDISGLADDEYLNRVVTQNRGRWIP